MECNSNNLRALTPGTRVVHKTNRTIARVQGLGKYTHKMGIVSVMVVVESASGPSVDVEWPLEDFSFWTTTPDFPWFPDPRISSTEAAQSLMDVSAKIEQSYLQNRERIEQRVLNLKRRQFTIPPYGNPPFTEKLVREGRSDISEFPTAPEVKRLLDRFNQMWDDHLHIHYTPPKGMADDLVRINVDQLASATGWRITCDVVDNVRPGLDVTTRIESCHDGSSIRIDSVDGLAVSATEVGAPSSAAEAVSAMLHPDYDFRVAPEFKDYMDVSFQDVCFNYDYSEDDETIARRRIAEFAMHMPIKLDEPRSMINPLMREGDQDIECCDAVINWNFEGRIFRCCLDKGHEGPHESGCGTWSSTPIDLNAELRRLEERATSTLDYGHFQIHMKDSTLSGQLRRLGLALHALRNAIVEAFRTSWAFSRVCRVVSKLQKRPRNTEDQSGT